MGANSQQDCWRLLSQRLCTIVGVVRFKEHSFLLGHDIKSYADAIAVLAVEARRLLRYNEWSDQHSLRCLSTQPGAPSFRPDASAELRRTAALALVKLILRRADHPCTSADHFLRTGINARIKTQRYRLLDSFDSYAVPLRPTTTRQVEPGVSAPPSHGSILPPRTTLSSSSSGLASAGTSCAEQRVRAT